MSSEYERKRYVELSKVANESAMQLGELHAEVKRVLKLWDGMNACGIESVGSDDGREYIRAEQLAEALGRLEAVVQRQKDQMDEDEAEGVQEQ